MKPEDRKKALEGLADSSLLMLADILPTGVFAAIQAINHPKVQPTLTGKPWPLCFDPNSTSDTGVLDEDRIFTAAIIGLGPVGVCASISLLDMLSSRKVPFRIVAIDPNESRRQKMQAVYEAIEKNGKEGGEFVVLSIDEAETKTKEWTEGVGVTAVLEVGGELATCGTHMLTE
jgi:hypothetical protein